jgi:SnoaL-like domain
MQDLPLQLRAARRIPARWRQSLFVWLITYPTVVLHLWLLQPIMSQLPMWAGTLLLTAPVSLLAVYLLTPLATRILYGWLMATGLNAKAPQVLQALNHPVQSELLRRFEEVVANGDVESWLALFTDEAEVVDWGRHFHGEQAIRSWNAREFIGTGGKLKLSAERSLGERVRVLADWRSSYYTGLSVFTFTLREGRIVSLEIDPL